jgi:hypothetical protein
MRAGGMVRRMVMLLVVVAMWCGVAGLAVAALGSLRCQHDSSHVSDGAMDAAR